MVKTNHQQIGKKKNMASKATYQSHAPSWCNFVQPMDRSLVQIKPNHNFERSDQPSKKNTLSLTLRLKNKDNRQKNCKLINLGLDWIGRKLYIKVFLGVRQALEVATQWFGVKGDRRRARVQLGVVARARVVKRMVWLCYGGLRWCNEWSLGWQRQDGCRWRRNPNLEWLNTMFKFRAEYFWDLKSN